MGRQLLALGTALGRVIAAFNRTKDDPSARREARAACDEALSELGASMKSLTRLRDSLKSRTSMPPMERHSAA